MSLEWRRSGLGALQSDQMNREEGSGGLALTFIGSVRL